MIGVAQYHPWYHPEQFRLLSSSKTLLFDVFGLKVVEQNWKFMAIILLYQYQFLLNISIKMSIHRHCSDSNLESCDALFLSTNIFQFFNIPVE